MTTNLRDAKARFSELVKLAASGEEVIITVRGEPMARLAPPRGVRLSPTSREMWVEELSSAAESAKIDHEVSTPQAFWDKSRQGRS